MVRRLAVSRVHRPPARTQLRWVYRGLRSSENLSDVCMDDMNLEIDHFEHVTRQERECKLCLILPRMLLHRVSRGGLISRDILTSRFDSCARGNWLALCAASNLCHEKGVGNPEQGVRC